jgi:methylated-DNA-[protein]-cysteine S-methyltransferase
VRVTRHRYTVEGWGVGELWAGDGVLIAHVLPRPDLSLGDEDDEAPELPDEAPESPMGGAWPPTSTLAADGARRGDDFVAELRRRFRRHLAGEPTSYEDVGLDLSWCTPFQAELAGALRRVPWGDIVSYGELAALAGRPRAARAAGTFCAHNRFSLVLPCHRVVGAEGIGGYGSAGVALKRRLLSLEGLVL